MIILETILRAAQQRLDSREKLRLAKSKQLDALRQNKPFQWRDVEDLDRLAERCRSLGFFEEVGELLRNPDDPASGRRVYEKIIAANNLLDVAFLSEGAQMSRAVGRITLPVTGGTRLGSGFMVSSRVMMTNNHVLGNSLEAADATIEFDFFRREDGTTGPVTRFRLQPQAFFATDEPLDFTLVAVEPVNAKGVEVSTRGWFPLVGPSGKAIVGERVSIIQHPNGDPQKVTVHDNKVSDVDPDDDFLHYQADTMGGSSGSPVLNINWDLAALHHAAVGNANEGVRISSIVKRLQQILANESADHRIDRVIAAELLSAKPASTGNAQVSAAPNEPGYPTADHPRMNPDGSASWVVPVTLTIGVGNSLPRPTSEASGASMKASPGSDDPDEQGLPSDDPDYQAALRAVEAGNRRVYYSKAKDTQAKKDYYPTLAGLSKADLYDTLSKLLSDTHTTVLSYKTARLTHLYPWIDRRENSSRQLRGIYSNKVFDALEVIRQEARMEKLRETAIKERIALESSDGVDEEFLESLEAAHPFNCEHVVPQSWFKKRKTPKTDLHHLFTCEWGCNSFRSNHAYFDFPQEAFRDNCGNRETGKFEPKRGKGAVARATLYFLLRHPGEIADTAKEMPKDRLNTLIEWAKGDKVDRWELHRNAEIQKVQGNRNPLIDFPELVDDIGFERGWA